MITDARALRTEFVPRQLHHREGQIDHLSSVLTPVSVADTGEHVCLYGPSGSGKTTLAKFTLERLEGEFLDVHWGYVNCIGQSTTGAVLAELVRDAGLGRDLRRSGTPTDVFLDRIRNCDGQFVAVLDEVDVLVEPRTTLSLTDLPDISVITICIDEDQWFSAVDERVRSRLRSAETITLERYSHQELVDILRYRVTHGLQSSRIQDDAIAAIADRAVGNARVAIAMLRRAAKHVTEQETRMMTPEIIETVADDARADIRDGHVRSLGTHQRALYSIVREAGSSGIGASEVHKRYEHRVQDPRTKRMRRQYLDSLKRCNLITADGSGRWTTYRVID